MLGAMQGARSSHWRLYVTLGSEDLIASVVQSLLGEQEVCLSPVVDFRTDALGAIAVLAVMGFTHGKKCIKAFTYVNGLKFRATKILWVSISTQNLGALGGTPPDPRFHHFTGKNIHNVYYQKLDSIEFQGFMDFTMKDNIIMVMLLIGLRQLLGLCRWRYRFRIYWINKANCGI